MPDSCSSRAPKCRCETRDRTFDYWSAPIDGLRIRVEGTCGRFIWAGGEPAVDPDFYQPLHVEHLAEYLPSVVLCLSLPGYRFQIADGHEDVWFDPALLSAK